MQAAIAIENLSKKYRLGHSVKTFREMISDGAKSWFRSQPTPPSNEIWALKDVSLTIGEGEVLGIIGKNGSGKSTLLKILSRITDPTEGRVILRGRVASLLEVGTGFHPEMTGRENVYLNAAILGMRRTEVTRLFDAIVDFAGVEQFIDTPMKRYSSGMYMRLAFSVAAHVRTDILIVDEVLAVGDLEFQKKCISTMSEISRTGNRTVLFVSHQMGAVSLLCSRAVRLAKGRVIDIGPAERIVNSYISSDLQTSNEVCFKPRTNAPSITRVSVDSSQFVNGALIVELEFSAPSPIVPHPGIVISSPDGIPLFGSNTIFHPNGYDYKSGRDGSMRLGIRNLPLIPGLYLLSAYLSDWQNTFDTKEHALQFSIPGAPLHPHRISARHIGYLNTPGSWMRSA